MPDLTWTHDSETHWRSTNGMYRIVQTRQREKPIFVISNILSPLREVAYRYTLADAMQAAENWDENRDVDKMTKRILK